MTQEEIDKAIVKYAPQETLYDQPMVDRGKRRVTGPFSVEAVPAPAVRSLGGIAARARWMPMEVATAMSHCLPTIQWRGPVRLCGKVSGATNC